MSTATVTAQEVRLHWSSWFHCESSFNLMLVPDRPGIFVIAEEVVSAVPVKGRGRNLNVIEVDAADDLFHSLNQLFAHHCPMRDKLENSRCFLRFAEVSDPAVRSEAVAQLQLDSPGGTVSPFVEEFVAPDAPPEDSYESGE